MALASPSAASLDVARPPELDHAAALRRRRGVESAVFFGSCGTRGDVWLPFWSWCYPFGLMAIAAMVAGLVSYNRARAAGIGMLQAPVFGLLAAWLHPWQGETLILVVLGGEVVSALLHSDREEDRIALRRRLLLLTATVIATALPL